MKNLINNQKTYVCECGKVFDNPQRFNGHKCHCLVHRSSTGSIDKWDDMRANIFERSKEALREKYRIIKEKKFEQWVSEQHTCDRCGKIMTEKYGSGRFCSKSCACSREHSEEEKDNIRKSLLKFYNKYDNLTNAVAPVKQCRICGKGIKNNSKTGLCLYCLHNTEEGISIMSANGKIGYQHKVENGTHKPWTSRNITSYAEKFWKTVLDNNNIQYEREYSVKLKYSHYFLDFYIEKNGLKIDLEIDGKQHNYKDRADHDNSRDTYLTNYGFIVYRVRWNEINSENGKELMKQKINDFLDYYDSL